jgi:hypothetical protein
MATVHNQSNVVDENDQNFFRLLIDGRIIKFATVEPGL